MSTTLTFVPSRNTKRTIVHNEQTDPKNLSASEAIGSLYVQKAALANMGVEGLALGEMEVPQDYELRVTLEVVPQSEAD